MGSVHLIIDEVQSLCRRFSREVVETTARAKRNHEKARIALSGGSVATHFLPHLVREDVATETIEVFWCDERNVPLDHDDSNFKAAKQLWFLPAGLLETQLFPMHSSGALEEDAKSYERLLRERGDAPLDLVLLGMGPDGHIASLFPGFPELSSRAWVEPVRESPKPPPERLTMTLPLLCSAARIIVAVFGESKAEALRRALTRHSQLPVAQLFQQAPHVQLWLDAAAASKLPPAMSTGATLTCESSF